MERCILKLVIFALLCSVVTSLPMLNGTDDGKHVEQFLNKSAMMNAQPNQLEFFMTDFCNSTVTKRYIQLLPNRSGLLHLTHPGQAYPTNFFCDVCIYPAFNEAAELWFNWVDLHVVDSVKCLPERVSIYKEYYRNSRDHMTDLCQNSTRKWWTGLVGRSLCVEFMTFNVTGSQDHTHRGFEMHFQSTDMNVVLTFGWIFLGIFVIVIILLVLCPLAVGWWYLARFIARTCLRSEVSPTVIRTCGLSLLLEQCCSQLRTRPIVVLTCGLSVLFHWLYHKFLASRSRLDPQAADYYTTFYSRRTNEVNLSRELQFPHATGCLPRPAATSDGNSTAVPVPGYTNPCMTGLTTIVFPPPYQSADTIPPAFQSANTEYPAYQLGDTTTPAYQSAFAVSPAYQLGPGVIPPYHPGPSVATTYQSGHAVDPVRPLCPPGDGGARFYYSQDGAAPPDYAEPRTSAENPPKDTKKVTQ